MRNARGHAPRRGSTYVPKIPVNKWEAQLFDILTGNGWKIYRKGWPDFACVKKDGEFCLIEIKPKRSHRLKAAQYELMLVLAAHGVKCYRWSPDGGFEPITPSIQKV